MIEILVGLAILVASGGLAAERVMAGIAALTRARAAARAMQILAAAHRLQITREANEMSLVSKLFGKAGAVVEDAGGLDVAAAAGVLSETEMLVEVHSPGEMDLPLALRSGPAPADGTNYRTVGSQALVVRPAFELDLTTGEPNAGMTQRRIATYLSAMIAAQIGTGVAPTDVCDVSVVDHQDRFVRFQVLNRTAETLVDLVVPVQRVTGELNGVLETYKAGVMELARQAHREHQDLARGKEMVGHAVEELRRLRSAPIVHANRAEFMLLETAMLETMQAGAPVPYAERSEQRLAAEWFQRAEDRDGGHRVIQKPDTRR